MGSAPIRRGFETRLGSSARRGAYVGNGMEGVYRVTRARVTQVSPLRPARPPQPAPPGQEVLLPMVTSRDGSEPGGLEPPSDNPPSGGVGPFYPNDALSDNDDTGFFWTLDGRSLFNAGFYDTLVPTENIYLDFDDGTTGAVPALPLPTELIVEIIANQFLDVGPGGVLAPDGTCVFEVTVGSVTYTSPAIDLSDLSEFGEHTFTIDAGDASAVRSGWNSRSVAGKIRATPGADIGDNKFATEIREVSLAIVW